MRAGFDSLARNEESKRKINNNMQKIRYLIIALLCAVVQGTWAQTEVSTENGLRSAITDGAYIRLMADIALSEKLEIGNGKIVTIDLNGKTLSRSLSANQNYGMVIYIKGGNLTINDSSGNSGSIEGGRSYNGAGILCESGSTLTVNGGTFRNNDVSRTDNGNHGRGGAIFMNPNTTLTVNGGKFENNSAYNGGAIYIDDGGPNSLTPASATISGAEFKNCWVTGDGGAIYNKGTLTVMGGTIQNNTANTSGGGIFSNSSLSMSGNPVVTDNTVSSGANNLYLGGGSSVINCGTFTSGAKIGITLETNNRVFTSGYSDNGNAGTDPSKIFLADTDSPVTILLGPSGEAWQVRGSDASFDFAGSGTEDDPYLIETATDWQMTPSASLRPFSRAQ